MKPENVIPFPRRGRRPQEARALPEWQRLWALVRKDVLAVMRKSGAPPKWGESEALFLYRVLAHPSCLDTQRKDAIRRNLAALWNKARPEREVNALRFGNLYAEWPDVLRCLQAIDKKLTARLRSPEIQVAYLIASEWKTPAKDLSEQIKDKRLFPDFPVTQKMIERARKRLRGISP